MNQQPQQESLWTRFVNWLLGLFRGSAGPSAANRSGQSGASSSPTGTSGAGGSTDRGGGIGARLTNATTATASRVSDTADSALDRGDKAWDHLLGKDQQPHAGASDTVSRADAATSDTAGSTNGAGAAAPTSSPSGSADRSDTAQPGADGEMRQGGEDATAYAQPSAEPRSGETTGAGTDSLVGERPGMGGSSSRTSSPPASDMAGASSSAPAASISDDEGSSAGLTGIEREAAERSRQHGTTAETSSGRSAANAGQAPAQAGQQDAGVGGDESDRLTLLAQPPVAGEDVVISSSSVTGFAPGQTGETATDDTAESLNDESLKESAGGTVAATAEPRSYADAEVGLSDEGPESAASSPTPTGEDAEFVAGTDIEWSSPAEWEELEEEAEVSAPVQATGAMNQASTSTSTATSSSSSQEIADSRGDAGTGTAGAGGGATATASDQATVPYGAIPGDGSRECPSDHPIKGNANSMIYHMPGQSSYDGTEPEYCFANEEDAVAAGYRASKARGRSDTGDEHAHQPQDARHGQDDETAGVAATTTTEPATTAEREMSLRSDADISTTPPAAITSRPGTNQPMGQAASGAMAAASMQTAPSSPASGTAASAHRGSVPGDGSRACPDDYPIKGNRNSMIYHMPHQSSYQGTKAEICFATEEEAISAGYRRRREPGESASDAHGHHGDNHGNASTAAHAGGSRDSQPGKEQTDGASAPGSDGHKAEAMTSSDATPQSGAPTGSVVGDGTHDCPAGYPIKGNASSRIYHMPGQSAYEVTEPEFCFATEEAATAAGYRAAKR